MSKIITENQNIIIFIKCSQKTDVFKVDTFNCITDPKDYPGHINHTLKWMHFIALEQMAYSTNFTFITILENCKLLQ